MSRLKEYREARGMTQAQLAKASGVGVRIIQNYEQGVRDLSKAQVMTVIRLAEALDCGIRDLIDI